MVINDNVYGLTINDNIYGLTTYMKMCAWVYHMKRIGDDMVGFAQGKGICQGFSIFPVMRWLVVDIWPD